MPGLKKLTTLELVFGAALCVVLIALAVLQYQWIGQVSEAERHRLQMNVHDSAERFMQDFDGELERLAQMLLGGRPHSGEPATAAEYQSRLSVWREASRYPQMVQYVFLAGDPAIPPPLRAFAERVLTKPSAGPPFPIVGGGEVAGLALPRIRNEPDGPISDGWLIVGLDLAYLRAELLPKMIQRDFGADYVVDIVTHGGTYIYRSQPQASLAYFDMVGALMDLRLGPPGRPGLPEGFGPPDGPPPGIRLKGKEFKGKSGVNLRPLALGLAEGAWRIMASYRGGSLETTVEGVRRRNLAVSFGMLLLAAASVALLVLSTRRARSLAQAQMEFVAGVTHELRTPLAVITSASQNLADGVAASPEQVRRYGLAIGDQGRRLAQMVEQILRFAGISSGRFEMHTQPVEVRAVVDQAVADCQPELAAAGCSLTCDIAPALPMVQGDAPALVHCLRNLLSNAVKHGAGSAVSVRAALANGRVEIRVEDQGPGIDAVDVPHIFEPFYRGRRALADQIQGTGLGLSLVKKIIEAHGGSIDVENHGRGACFILRLPMAKDA